MPKRRARQALGRPAKAVKMMSATSSVTHDTSPFLALPQELQDEILCRVLPSSLWITAQFFVRGDLPLGASPFKTIIKTDGSETAQTLVALALISRKIRDDMFKLAGEKLSVTIDIRNPDHLSCWKYRGYDIPQFNHAPEGLYGNTRRLKILYPIALNQHEPAWRSRLPIFSGIFEQVFERTIEKGQLGKWRFKIATVTDKHGSHYLLWPDLDIKVIYERINKMASMQQILLLGELNSGGQGKLPSIALSNIVEALNRDTHRLLGETDGREPGYWYFESLRIAISEWEDYGMNGEEIVRDLQELHDEVDD